MQEKENDITYVMHEWEEAWAQSRHLEMMRGQYLGFFFTVVLGVIAIAGPPLADDSLQNSGALLVLAALAIGLQVLSGFLYLAVVRLNVVLRYYMEIIFAIREVMIPAGQATVDLTHYARPPLPAKDWASTSGVSKRVLQFGLVGMPLVLAGAVARSVDVLGDSATTFVCAAALLASLVIALLVHLAKAQS